MARHARETLYGRVGKRALDLALVSCGLILGWPLMLLENAGSISMTKYAMPPIRGMNSNIIIQ